MTRTSTAAVAALVPLLLLAGCYTASSYSREVEPVYAPPPRYLEGRVESVREVVQRTQGDPAGGAVAGGVVGGLLGGALTGRGIGALVGAAGGAVTGAAVSQGSSEYRHYEVYVRFDDGSRGRIDYAGYPRFRPGDRVRQGPRGLELVRTASPPPANPPPPPASPPPPPSSVPPPPPLDPPPPGEDW